MGAEKALMALGMVGRYQIFHYIMVGALHSFPGALQFSSVIFIAYAGHEYHCGAKPNLSLVESVPRENDNTTWSQCLQYKDRSVNNETEPCTQWDIDPNPFEWTTVMEWNLVCDKSLYIEISQLLFLTGLSLGCITCVPFSDWFGRRPAFFVCQFLCCLFGICMAFATSPEMLWIMQILTGMFTSGNDLAGFVLGNELFPADMRVYSAPAMSIFGTIGQMLFVFIAYFARHWRELQLAASSLPLLVLLYFYVCPESVRWLTVNKRFEEAQKVLDQAAKMNRLPRVPQEYLTETDDAVKKSNTEGEIAHNPTLKSFLSHKKTLSYYLVISFCILVTSLMQSSINFLTQVLPGDLFVNFTINSVLAFPGVLLAIFAMSFFGRRNSLSGLLFISAVTMSIATLLELLTDQPQLVTAFTLLTRFSSQASWSIELVYVQEIFPTAIRSQGVGLVALLGFCGYLLSPGALYLARTISLGLTLGVIAGMVAVASLLSRVEPETLGRVLPTTTEEVLGWPRSLSAKDWENVKAGRMKLWAEIRGKGTGISDESTKMRNRSPHRESTTEMDNHAPTGETHHNEAFNQGNDPCHI